MQMGYDFENSLLAAEASAGLRPRAEGGDAPRLSPRADLPLADLSLADPARADAPAPLADAGDRLAPRHPDWAGLRARFAAIHALHRALADQTIAAPATGSFAAAGESVLSACRNGTSVNPVYWVNSKGPCAITGSVAAAPHAATED